LHTIAWSVTDSLGRTEGIGSRFFTVLNSGADQFGGARRAWASAPPDGERRGDDDAVRTARALAPPDGVWGRTGFDLLTAWAEIRPRDDGRYRVRLPEMGRLELSFGAPVEAGYLVAPDGTRRDLPVGSRLDEARFGWAVPVGYHGAYQLEFVRGGDAMVVDVTIAPVARAEDGESEIRMHVDAVRTVGRSVRVEGWAFDPRAALDAGIGAVHVWARSVQGSGPFFVGEATLDVPRPDVAQAHGDAPGRAGFTLSTTLAPGTYEFTAYVWNVRTARWEDARTVRGQVR